MIQSVPALMDFMQENDEPLLEAYDELVILLSKSNPGTADMVISGLLEAYDHGAFPLAPNEPAPTRVQGGGIG